MSPENDLETYNKTSPWYIFNDSNVSLSSFESFKGLSKQSPRETAYVLFYQKVTNLNTSSFQAPSLLVPKYVEDDNAKLINSK